MLRSHLYRVVAAALFLLSVPAQSRAQSAPAPDPETSFIMPVWSSFIRDTTQAALNEQVAQLKSRLGPEGTKVKLGFTIYIGLKMNSWTVDPTNRAGLRAGLSDAILD